jgi:hypothetical protein
MFPRPPNAASLDFDELDEFLMSDRAPENCMQLSDLQVFSLPSRSADRLPPQATGRPTTQEADRVLR